MSEAKKKVAEVRNLNEGRNQELVAMFEEFLELAKEGHLSDVAIIGKVRGASMTEFNWDSGSPLELVGALEMAKIEVTSEVLAEALGDAEDDED